MNKVSLADDIIETNILTRLPVKTLIRFRAVCKSWYSLLSDASFLNMRRKIQKNTNNINDLLNMHRKIQKNTNNNLLLVNDRQGDDLKVIDHCWREIFPSFVNICDFTFTYVSVVDCCEGLVCVLGYNDFGSNRHAPFPSGCVTTISLWNPALRINKTIWSYPASRKRVCTGFGYHRKTNDYKVIKFRNSIGRIEDVMIYSLNSNSWRKIELCVNELTDYNHVEEFGVYVSCCTGGAYCWIAHSDDRSYRIISFHMKDEVFKKILLPTSVTCRDRGAKIFNYKDSLALLYMHSRDSNKKSTICDIWVMNECDEHKSWTKICEFEYEWWYPSFVGVVETKLMIGSPLKKKYLKVVNIEKSEMNIERSFKKPRFFTEARRVTSFTESFALLSNKSF